MASEGPNGYTAFYNSLKASPAAPFLAGQIDIANEPLGQLIQQGKRLVVMGWDDLPEDIGVRDVSWLTDSWNNPQNVADLQKQQVVSIAFFCFLCFSFDVIVVLLRLVFDVCIIFFSNIYTTKKNRRHAQEENRLFYKPFSPSTEPAFKPDHKMKYRP